MVTARESQVTSPERRAAPVLYRGPSIPLPRDGTFCHPLLAATLPVPLCRSVVLVPVDGTPNLADRLEQLPGLFTGPQSIACSRAVPINNLSHLAEMFFGMKAVENLSGLRE